MNDEKDVSSYLWDRTPSGNAEADSALLRWEERLGRYRRAPRPQLASKPAPGPGAAKYCAVAACLALVGALAWRELLLTREANWTRQGERMLLHKKYWLEQAETVEIASMGRLRFAPKSRFRILRSGREEVMELLEGKFDALILADPYRFRVVTAGVQLDDLGCAYEVSVNRQGAGRVEVSLGWVRANGAGEDSFIAQGYEATFRPGEPPSEPRRVQPAGAGPDILALLHKVWRAPSEDERMAAFDALARRYPPPPGVTRERARQADRKLVKEWWPELPLGKPIAFPDSF
jgi:hypothetical protein